MWHARSLCFLRHSSSRYLYAPMLERQPLVLAVPDGPVRCGPVCLPHPMTIAATARVPSSVDRGKRMPYR